MNRDERGSIILLYAFAMTSIAIMAALVLDLAQLRTDRRVNKTVADMAVRAGLGVLPMGPWSGVCRARDYVGANTPGFSSFDPGSEKWFQLGSPLQQVTSSPCLNTGVAPFVSPCVPGGVGVPRTDTWGKLTATAGGGRFTIEIQSGYAMPDARFPEDQVALTDAGDPLKGSCDNLAVMISERSAPFFGGIVDGLARTTTIRSVGRLSNISTGEYNPALLLLERHGCDVLVAGSNNTRVIAQPYQNNPGVIQIDSADDDGGCSNGQAVLNGAATSGGPSIIACSAKTAAATPGCNLATANKPGRMGVHALNFLHPPGDRVTTDFPDTYGDTRAVASAQSGRQPLDDFYRENVEKLDDKAEDVVTGNAGKPPDCAAVVNHACTGNGVTWLVLQQADCDTLSSNSSSNFFTPPVPVDPPRTRAQNIWFNCDLSVKTPAPLALLGADSYVVVTGRLQVLSDFSISDPRTVYIGGRSSGNGIGLDVGNNGILSINAGAAEPFLPDCELRAGLGRYTKVVVGKGSMALASGGAANLCQTFVLMASSYDKIPATNNTAPCSDPCDDYKGTVSVGSGASVDWTAPNLVVGRRPDFDEVDLDSVPAPLSPYEDLGVWTEAGGTSNSISGNGSTKMAGIFFLGNADAFTLAGNSGANVYLSAQFISRTMKVTGGAVVNLVLNPWDGVPVVAYELILVR